MKRIRLCDDPVLLAHLDKGGDGTLDLFAGVERRELRPDTHLTLGNDRKTEPYCINAFVKEIICLNSS